MAKDCICFQPIGIIHTPFDTLENMPIQPTGAKAVQGTVVVDDDFVSGLTDLEGFSHIILFYHFNRSAGFKLRVKPFMDTVERGVFATRAPRRPNALGFSVVALENRDGAVLAVRGIDVLNHTPLLDIKPYVPAFDSPAVTAIGWLSQNAGKAESLKSDRRFADET